MSSPKEFHIDAVYPEPLSRLRRGHGGPNIETSNSASYRRAVKKQRNRGPSGSGRFRTQPVTFQEIKEVDEDNIVEGEGDTLRGSAGAMAPSSAFKSESDLKASFQLFYQSIQAGTEEDPMASSTPTKELTVLTFDTNSRFQSSPDAEKGPALPQKTQSTPINIALHARSRQSF